MLKSRRTLKSALPWPTKITPIAITITRPVTSTMVISMLATTDSVMPMKLRNASTRMKPIITARAGTPDQTSAKYDEKPAASEPAAANVAER